jgi:hypothetical protein
VAIIQAANRIITDYAGQGFVLTLRQLYYQFVQAGVLANMQRNYKRLGSIVNDARLGGLIDWNAIEDRGRSLRGVGHFKDPAECLRVAVAGYRIDMWARQNYKVEIWIAKEALAGVVERVAVRNRVDYFSCKGYNSQSEMHVAAMRLKRYAEAGKTPAIIHLGDHDPSGIDMTRDIRDRLRLFMGEAYAALEMKRIALNMTQIKEHRPPPNPAKVTDSRFETYAQKYGEHSWELDALNPRILAALIQKAIDRRRDPIQWEADKIREETERREIEGVAGRWNGKK